MNNGNTQRDLPYQLSTPTIQDISSTPAEGARAPLSDPDSQANINGQFLLQYNERLRRRNNLLHEEVEALRRQYGENQAQLSELRDALRSLDRSLQDLLYLPAIRNGDGEVPRRLFLMFDTVIALDRALGSEARKGREELKG